MTPRCKTRLLSRHTSCVQGAQAYFVAEPHERVEPHWLLYTNTGLKYQHAYQSVCRITQLGLESAALFPVPSVHPAKASL